MSTVDQGLRVAGGKPDEFLVRPEHEIKLKSREPIEPVYLVRLVIHGANARIELARNREGLGTYARVHE